MGPKTSLVASKRGKDMECFVGCTARSVVTILTELPQPPIMLQDVPVFSPVLACLPCHKNYKQQQGLQARNDTEMKTVEFIDVNSNIV